MTGADRPTRRFLYVGCYTNRSDVGIAIFDASEPNGALAEVGACREVEHPSFLAPHPRLDVLYAVSETSEPDSGTVVALAVDPTDGALTPIDRASSHGAAPCHVAVDADGANLYVANYVDGSIAAYAIGGDGRFGELRGHRRHRGSGPTSRQEGPHAHGVRPMADGSLLVTDLGTDEVLRYRHAGADRSGPLELHDVLALPPGRGPRHAATHPARSHAYVVGELDSTITVLGVAPATAMRVLASVAMSPAGRSTDSLAAAVVVDAAGDRLYASNRGPDTIDVFELTDDPAAPPRLLDTVASGGRTPRDLALHPSGRHLVVANQDSGEVAVHELDEDGVPSGVVATYPVSEPAGLAVVEVVA